MRTTVRIDDQLHRYAKALAAHMGCTISSLIEDSLRQTLSRRPARPRHTPVKLKTVSGHGPKPGVNLDNSAKLLDYLEQANG